MDDTTDSSAEVPTKPVRVLADLVASVLHLRSEVGSAVAEGDVLLVVESMKMEIQIVAPCAGSIARYGVDVGDVVQEGDLLVELQP